MFCVCVLFVFGEVYPCVVVLCAWFNRVLCFCLFMCVCPVVFDWLLKMCFVLADCLCSAWFSPCVVVVCSFVLLRCSPCVVCVVCFCSVCFPCVVFG